MTQVPLIPIGAAREDVLDAATYARNQGAMRSRDEALERLYSIEGQPPPPWDLPPGCRFAPRCPHADDRCRAEYPPSYKVGEGHTADCWLLEKAGSRVENSSKQETAA